MKRYLVEFGFVIEVEAESQTEAESDARAMVTMDDVRSAECVAREMED